MRLVSFHGPDGSSCGVVREGRVVDAGAPMREVLASGGLEELGELDGPATPLADLELLPPIPDPDKIICIGLNYAEHAREGRVEPPASPTFFAKFRNALRPDGAAVELPATSEKIDYEAEIAFVVGRRANALSAADALDHVAGYTLFNDLSARDLQFATPQWMPGKVFDGAAPCGPAVVTPDEAGPPDALGIALDLNGQRMQEATTGDLIFSIPDLLAYLSSLMTLEPGDVVATGTPSGVGGAREPRVWLKPGDEIVVSSPQLGDLRTRIA
ncbi:MAG TPA: fumarylacetoacetate hydrolase family protein [Solirubrobacterales bacterium]|nr:fumarylacetoacetate hydrolase family protein [Solirubrobacterales bacterium]